MAYNKKSSKSSGGYAPKKYVGARKEFMEEVMDRLEKGQSIMRPMGFSNQRRTGRNPVSGSVYKGVNCLISNYAMMKNGWTDNRFVTINQLNVINKANATEEPADTENIENEKEGTPSPFICIKKGEKATTLELWRNISVAEIKSRNQKIAEAKKAVEDKVATPEQVKMAEMPFKKEQEEIVALRIPVFNFEQIKGYPDFITEKNFKKEFERINEKTQIFESEQDTIEKAKNVLESNGILIAIDPNRDYASYDYIENTVSMPPETAFNSPSEYAGALLYKAVEGFRNIEDKANLSQEEKTKGQFISEIASVFLCFELGLPISEDYVKQSANNSAYYAKMLKSNPKLLTECIKTAEEATQKIAGNFFTTQAIAQVSVSTDDFTGMSF